jgi:hypothetical protein
MLQAADAIELSCITPLYGIAMHNFGFKFKPAKQRKYQTQIK